MSHVNLPAYREGYHYHLIQPPECRSHAAMPMYLPIFCTVSQNKICTYSISFSLSAPHLRSKRISLYTASRYMFPLHCPISVRKFRTSYCEDVSWWWNLSNTAHRPRGHPSSPAMRRRWPNISPTSALTLKNSPPLCSKEFVIRLTIGHPQWRVMVACSTGDV